jgi:hypothetical protein
LENFGNGGEYPPPLFLAKSAHATDTAGDMGFLEFRRVRKLLKRKDGNFCADARMRKECASDRKAMG